jgi:hypothetical protein
MAQLYGTYALWDHSVVVVSVSPLSWLTNIGTAVVGNIPRTPLIHLSEGCLRVVAAYYALPTHSVHSSSRANYSTTGVCYADTTCISPQTITALLSPSSHSRISSTLLQGSSTSCSMQVEIRYPPSCCIYGGCSAHRGTHHPSHQV